MTTIAERLDDIGKPAWIGLTIASFIIFWPLGFIVVGYLIGSGRIMGCFAGGNGGAQGNSGDRWRHRMERMQRRMDRMQAAADRWWGPRPGGGTGSSRSNNGGSGNHAFDEYRAETLRRLEEEQREFLDFLQRLRHAKDKAEFDQFMSERRRPDPGQSPA